MCLVLFRSLLASHIALSVCGCTSDSSPETTRYLVTGSSTVAPIVQEVSEQIEATDPTFRIDVQTGGSTRGIVDTSTGRNDAGMSSRTLKPDEAEGLTVITIAYDGIALIAHADNPTEQLTAAQVRGLFTKEIRDWNAVGPHRGKVVVVNKAEGRATLEVFLEHFGLENRRIKADAVIGDNAQGVRLVSSDRNAIGYVSIGEALHAISRGVSIRLLSLDGVTPSLESVGDGSYPIRRSLYVLFSKELDERDRQLLDHLQGPEGREVISSLRFIPVANAP